MSERLRRESEELAEKAAEAQREADRLKATSEAVPPLDPDFAENLEKTLAEPRQELRDLAKLAR